jgi:hypothetical protein
VGDTVVAFEQEEVKRTLWSFNKEC